MTMDQTSRADRALVGLITELADARTPDYLEAAIEGASSRPQRPTWTFPGRWLPMAEITSRSAFAPRLPWRTIAVALLLIALVLASVVFIGSRQPKVPPPFGVARNGLMLYGSSGDIYTLDPTTGTAALAVGGAETDRFPFFSRDGTRFAFLRRTGDGAENYQIVVANADGSDQRVITTDPVTFDYSINWSADGRSILLDDTNGHVTRLDAIGTNPPEKVTYPGVRDIIALRPPDEGQLLYRTVTAEGWALWVMDVDGTHAHPLLPSDAVSMNADDYVGYGWSPDGSKVAFRTHIGTSEESRIFVANADGTGLRRLTHESGIECECDMFWSPDGTQIGFNRWRRDPTTGDWHSRPLAIASVADGTIREIGPLPTQDNGAEFAFSPDGTSITWVPRAPDGTTPQAYQPLVLDIASGTSRTVNASADSPPDWQRLAR